MLCCIPLLLPHDTTVRLRTSSCDTCEYDDDDVITSTRREAAAAATPATAKGMRRAPSIEALAMADADWAQHCAFDDDDEGAPPPEHLRALEAFIDAVVPVDMVLAFGREQSARARRGEQRRDHQEDVKEKLKLWAKAVAAKTRRDITRHHNNQNACAAHGV